MESESELRQPGSRAHTVSHSALHILSELTQVKCLFNAGHIVSALPALATLIRQAHWSSMEHRGGCQTDCWVGEGFMRSDM